MNETTPNVTKSVRSSIFNEDGSLADLKWPTDYLIIALIGRQDEIQFFSRLTSLECGFYQGITAIQVSITG